MMGAKMAECDCEDWDFAYKNIRNCWDYAWKQLGNVVKLWLIWHYCPWCGEKLKEDGETDEQA